MREQPLGSPTGGSSAAGVGGIAGVWTPGPHAEGLGMRTGRPHAGKLFIAGLRNVAHTRSGGPLSVQPRAPPRDARGNGVEHKMLSRNLTRRATYGISAPG